MYNGLLVPIMIFICGKIETARAITGFLHVFANEI